MTSPPCVNCGYPCLQCATLKTALDKINAIRNSIVGSQSLNWSEHAYPLVAALEEAGIKGQPYPEARANLGTLLEQNASLKTELADLRSWSCETNTHGSCTATIGSLEDNNPDEPTAGSGGGCWFCLECWNREMTKARTMENTR